VEVERHLLEKSGKNPDEVLKSVSHILRGKMLTHPCLADDEEELATE
jgi:hypothetical protein